jgi:ribosomal protein S18 acetylase RimI-like enzyme
MPGDEQVEITWHRVGTSAAYIAWFAVPAGARRRGLGERAYAQWERELPKAVTTVRLHAADSGDGPSSGFWERVGFSFRWNEDDVESAVAAGANRIEVEQEMEKQIRKRSR